MINERVRKLREQMKQNGIDAYLLPGTDPHQDEYLPEHWKRRAFISGFTGSYGQIAITLDKAVVWTDGRYEIQIKQELNGTPFEGRIKEQHTADLYMEINWIIGELLHKNGGVIGIDPQLVNINQAEAIKETLKHHHKISLKYLEKNLIDEIWENRPSLPNSPVIFRDEKFENVSASEKVEKLQKIMIDKEIDMHVVSNLESIARILNVRASDINYNPLAISYLIVETDKILWFIDENRFPVGYKNKLPKNCEIFPYNDFIKTLNKVSKGKNVLIDPNEISQAIMNRIEASADVKREASPIIGIKAIKNKFEIDRMFEANIQDGISVLKAIYWLKNEVKKRTVSEWEMAEKIEELKKEQKDFMYLSFNTIVSYKANGAIIHYFPKKESCVDIKPEGIVLIDNGGQYLGATTDMTRTISVGKTSREIKENYTRVLKGHVNVARIKFPQDTRAYQLDALARQFLWAEGLGYQHGTGHGVGYCTCVHETTNVGISPLKPVILEEGMTLSNEPGYYKEGEYGIRIENVVAIEKDEELTQKNGKYTFLRFMQLTLCPYERDLIVMELLNPREINWINNYHKLVIKTLRPHIQEQNLINWLEEACAPLTD
ncbi:MAG: aminopeptidase P family protein [bacterium]